MLVTLARDINNRRERLQKYYRYYQGKQRISFVGAELQHEFGERLQYLSCNRCETVIDSVLDRLTIDGFEDKAAESNHEKLAESYWSENNLGALARQVHQEALIHGDAYVLVWPNETVEVFAQHSDQLAVAYDDENPDKLYCAAKAWKLRTGHWRINLYYEDRLEKYRSRKPSADLPDNEAAWDSYSDPEDTSWPLNYSWGRVPVFHFAVNARSGEYGRSDLAPIIPLQDSLNRTLANQAVAEEFQSYKQRWATGIQPIEDPETHEYISPFEDGADRLWTSTNENTRFGQFDSADLTMFENVINGHELRIARTARIPIHYFTGLGTPPSGEALKTYEQPFIAKIKDRQRSFGATWKQLMNFVLSLEHGVEAKVEVRWHSAETRDETQLLSNAIIKKELGVSQQQVLRELDYSDEQIEEFADEKAVDADALVRAFNEGE